MFKSCFKKDVLEQLRTKKFYVYLALAIGMSIFSLLIFPIMRPIVSIQTEQELFESLKELFKLTYSNSLSYFMSFMLSYFLLVVIIMIRNSFSKEMKNDSWLLPKFCGIKTETLVTSKLLVNTLSVVISYLCAVLIHFIATIIFFTPDVVNISNLIFSYFAFMLALIFFVVLTLSVDALTKKGAIACVVSILILIIGTSILEGVYINSVPLISYTPLAFYSLSITLSFSDINVLAITIASISYLILLGGLIWLTIKKSKLKPEK